MRLPCPVLVLLSSCCCLSLAARRSGDDDDFDVVIFAQSWPVTTCIEWKERGRNNRCTIRKEEEDAMMVAILVCRLSGLRKFS